MAITAAAPATATGMSSRMGVAGALMALAMAAAGCGVSASTSPRPQATGGPFAWLSSGPAPAAWPAAGLLAGGSLPRPPGWGPLRGDHGTVSFIARHHGAIVGYLNATPRSGEETLTNWEHFRIAHNAEEGDRDVRALGGAIALRVGASRMSCVKDSYRTSLNRYIELACLIARPRGSTVVLGAAPPADWAAQRAVIERAIAGFVAS